MKKTLKQISVVAWIIFIVLACGPDETPIDNDGGISFIVHPAVPEVGRTRALVPDKLVLSLEAEDGRTIFDDKEFQLSSSSEGYRTESIPLALGAYKVTKYLVISGDEVVFATPRTGAPKASLLDNSLPLEVSVNAGMATDVAPGIIGISPEDEPQDFGYANFGYKLPTPATEWMDVRVKLEITLGGILYPNIDASVLVEAFDANNEQKWSESYTYLGPEANDVRIKRGFARYTISFVKWGQTLTQNFVESDLWEGRVHEGAVPVTKVFQATIAPKRLAQQLTSMTRLENGHTVNVPVSRLTYVWQGDKLQRINSERWSETAGSFVSDTRSEFAYVDGRVDRIRSYNADATMPQAEDLYTYTADGKVKRIEHKTVNTGTTNVDFTHEFNDRLITASYTFSNGSSFQYQFVSRHGSVKSDKTTRGGELCSEGEFTFDKNVNPTKHLGYVDYLLRNYSAGNRLTEHVNYRACSFPSFVAESYTHQYDIDGYPLQSTTHFRGTPLKSINSYSYAD